MLKKRLRVKWHVANLALLFALFVSATASAYSGTGGGTALNPFKVATCSQLQDVQNDLTAYYQQTGDIDCAVSSGWNSGAGFLPIGRGTAFSGHFDGQGFKIKNLHINADNNGFTALFAQTDGATLTNVHLENGSIATDPSSTYYSGTLIGFDADSTVSNCSSTANVSGQYGGGLVGYISGGTLSECWYGGTTSLTGYRYTGGMFGLTVNTTITNVYSQGTLQARGGIAGVIGTGTTFSNAYSTADVTYNDTDAAGGLFGSIDGVASATTADNIFFDGTVTATSSSDKGGDIGSLEGGATVSGVFYNAFGCNCASGIGTTSGGTGSATGVNAGNADPNYFKSNHTNAPMDSWNFTSVWQTNSGSYPTLRNAATPSDSDGDGILNAVENAGPNGGDANNDGILDSAETNVTSFINPVTGEYVSIASTCDQVTNASVAAEGANAVQDAIFNYPLGLANFTLACNTPGQTTTVTVRYYYTTNPGTVVARKYDSTAKTYQAVPNATITDAVIGGQKVLTVNYQIVDGGALDEDGLANGTIIDPIGLATSNVTAPNTGFGGTARQL